LDAARARGTREVTARHEIGGHAAREEHQQHGATHDLHGRTSRAPSGLLAALAAAAAALLAPLVLLVDGRVADLGRALRRVAALLRALLDVMRLTALLARVRLLAASSHAGFSFIGNAMHGTGLAALRS